MFKDFSSGTDALRRKRTAVSTLVSLLVYGALGGVVAVYASQDKDKAECEVDADCGPNQVCIEGKCELGVAFAPAPEPTPAAAPPPPPPPPTAAPPPPPEMKVRKVAPPKNDPMKPPDEVPENKPEEGDPNAGVAVVDTGSDPGGANTGVAPPEPPPPAPPPPPPPPPPKPRRADPINLPENATPPTPSADNAAPEYPAAKRAEGVEAVVILKIVVGEDGRVGQVQVMKGDEPFVAAALAAVKTWRFTPALVDGQPTAVFRIVKIPFRIKS